VVVVEEEEARKPLLAWEREKEMVTVQYNTKRRRMCQKKARIARDYNIHNGK